MDASDSNAQSHSSVLPGSGRREVQNFASDGDIGEVWFGTEAAQLMLKWLYRRYNASSAAAAPTPRPTILDVGSGNGHLLFSLCGAGDESDDENDDEDDYSDEEEEDDGQGSAFRPAAPAPAKPFTDARRMCGVDYSPASIQLCRDIAAAKSAVQEQAQVEEGGEDRGQYDVSVKDIHWREGDLLQREEVRALNEMASGLKDQRAESAGQPGTSGEWDIILDKGTLDAIALAASSPSAEDAQTPLQKYISSLLSLLQPGTGLLLITSCNFTAEELLRKFGSCQVQGQEGRTLRFKHMETLPPRRVFEFGGKKGSDTVCVAFGTEWAE